MQPRLGVFCVKPSKDYLMVMRSTVFTPSPSTDKMYMPFELLLRSITLRCQATNDSLEA